MINILARSPWAHTQVSLGKRRGIAGSWHTGLFLLLTCLGKLPTEWLCQFMLPPTAYDSCPHSPTLSAIPTDFIFLFFLWFFLFYSNKK